MSPWFTATYTDRRAFDALQRVLASGHVSVGDMGLVRISDAPSYRTLTKRTVLMKEVLLLDAFKQSGEGDNEPVYYVLANDASPCLVPWQFPWLYRIFLFDSDLAAYRRLVPELEGIAADASYRETRGQATAFDAHVGVEPGGVLTAATMPYMPTFVEMMATADARRRLACVGLAMCQYRAKNGRFPEKLEDLRPDFLSALPVDPFDDKPLKLRHAEDRVIVYSVGPDMKDDGGAAFDESNKTGDILFELPNGTP